VTDLVKKRTDEVSASAKVRCGRPQGAMCNSEVEEKDGLLILKLKQQLGVKKKKGGGGLGEETI
jgi:hypothetical protein